jgi:hypothetical protein
MRSEALLVSLACLGIACSSGESATSGGVGGMATSTPPPAFTDTTGEAANPPAAYPAGPYGVTSGAIIPNYRFMGYRDAQKDKTALQLIQLADFYNPHGKDPSYQPASGAPDDRYFPMDSGYENAGKLKPTVLLVDIASVWCGPCNAEAATVLPPKHAEYLPCGGEFLLQLADGPTPGKAAVQTNLTAWTTKYTVNYPGVIDPRYKLDSLYAINAFPENAIIDTTTMKIVEVLGGEAAPKTCGNYAICTADTDCQTCTNNLCGDGTMCTVPADCATKTCTKTPFWTHYEALLDKTRPGCNVQ